MWLKFCGITRPEQVAPLAALLQQPPITQAAMGLIAVEKSPRYLPLERFAAVANAIPPGIERVGVFMDCADLAPWIAAGSLTAVQLHGVETPATCAAVKADFPSVKVIKAFRLRSRTDLEQLSAYAPYCDACLLDAFHPEQGGGTGHAFDWRWLNGYTFPCPWILAGGLRPDNVAIALAELTPWGLDVSSGIEVSPGIKDLARSQAFIKALQECINKPNV